MGINQLLEKINSQGIWFPRDLIPKGIKQLLEKINSQGIWFPGDLIPTGFDSHGIWFPRDLIPTGFDSQGKERIKGLDFHGNKTPLREYYFKI